jgi:uncharacterized membrane protein HdeD (DUF308 family)
MPNKLSAEISKSINELWWIGILYAIFSILFGIVAIFWPGLTLYTLVLLFSAFIIVMGIIGIVHGLVSIKRRDTWWMTLVIGMIGLGAGIYLVRHPRLTFATFILVVGIALIARGVLSLIEAFIDHPTSYKVIEYIAGLAAIAVGIIIMLQPVAGGVAFVWVLGLYALVIGTIALAVSISQRSDLDKVRDELKK